MIADLLDVARTATAPPSARVPPLAFQPQSMQTLALQAEAGQGQAYYLRVHSDASAQTERAVLRALARAGLQARLHGRYAQAQQSAHQVLLTQPVTQAMCDMALAHLTQLPGLRAAPLALAVACLD